MKRKQQHKSTAIGSIRIISGQWRGRKLPVANAKGLRPTTDRTKETVFNWLLGDVQGARCLDFFAGSGGLGFECLSRYAKEVVFVEMQQTSAQLLTQNCIRLGVKDEQVRVHVGDAIAVAASLSPTFDMVFIDPPFHQQLIDPSIRALLAHQLVAVGSKVYLEYEAGFQPSAVPENWQRIRCKQTAQVEYCLYQINPMD